MLSYRQDGEKGRFKMLNITDEYYRRYYITGSENTGYIYVDRRGIYSTKVYKTLDECKSAIDKDVDRREKNFAI